MNALPEFEARLAELREHGYTVIPDVLMGDTLKRTRDALYAVAESDRKQPFILNDAVEIRGQFCLGVAGEKVTERALDHAADQLRAVFQILHEPFQREAIDQRNDGIR